MDLADVLRLYEERHKLAISFEVCHPALYRIKPLLLEMKQYQHHAPVCIHHKSRDYSRSCFREKERTIALARGGGARGRTCRYGVWEYVAPVTHGDQLLGVFFLGGFAGARGGRRPKSWPPGLSAPPEPTREIRATLKRVAAFLVEFVKLEISHANVEPLLGGQSRGDCFYVESCRDFIDGHFQRNIALADLAERLRVNPNYLGGLLRRLTGRTFRQQLTERRLAEAEEWLRTRKHCSIAEVAYSCGFQDSNYFSAVFRKRKGMTPQAYKKRHQTPILYTEIGLNSGL